MIARNASGYAIITEDVTTYRWNNLSTRPSYLKHKTTEHSIKSTKKETAREQAFQRVKINVCIYVINSTRG